MFDLYNASSNSKKGQDMVSNTSLASSVSNNSNYTTNINSSDSNNTMSEKQKRTKFTHVFNQRNETLDSKKATKLKSNLIERFNENPEEEKELSQSKENKLPCNTLNKVNKWDFFIYMLFSKNS